jgi:hypothetical protein
MCSRAGVIAWLVAALTSVAVAQEPQLAPEGAGLLPEPSEEAALGGTPAAHPFEPDASGGFSRIVFSSEEDPNFKVVIREYAFPPDNKPHVVTLRAAAVVHVLGEGVSVAVAKAPLELKAAARATVPANTPIEVTNRGEREVVIRFITLEGKQP